MTSTGGCVARHPSRLPARAAVTRLPVFTAAAVPGIGPQRPANTP
jgi:hypothetical protein